MVAPARPKPATLPAPVPMLVAAQAPVEARARPAEPLLEAPRISEYGPCIAPPVSEYGPWIAPRRRGDGTFRLGPLLKIASAASGISVIDIKSDRRPNNIVRARQVFCWLAKRFSLESLPSIGRAAGGKDHTTVLHAVRRIEKIAEMVETPRIDGPQEWAQALLAVKWPQHKPGPKPGSVRNVAP
jgi:hypothetical protein